MAYKPYDDAFALVMPKLGLILFNRKTIYEMHKNTLELFAFVKDEVEIIEFFIKHHIEIFDEITIVDNGSTDGTLEVIGRYPVKLVINHCPFSMKGEVCTDLMLKSECDLLVPMDADEKVVFDNGTVIKKDPILIREYLQSVEITGCKYMIRKIYNHHPDNDGWYDSSFRHTKIIFPRETFMYTDPGFHRGRTKLDEESSFEQQFYWRCFEKQILTDKVSSIDVSYFHYHYASKERWLKNTEKKLKARLGDKWNDIDFLKSYTGPSVHCKREYLNYVEQGIWCNLEKNTYIEEG